MSDQVHTRRVPRKRNRKSAAQINEARAEKLLELHEQNIEARAVLEQVRVGLDELLPYIAKLLKL